MTDSAAQHDGPALPEIRAVAAGASPAVVEASYRAMIGAFVELELGVHGRA